MTWDKNNSQYYLPTRKEVENREYSLIDERSPELTWALCWVGDVSAECNGFPIGPCYGPL